MLAYSPDHVPLADRPPERPTQVTITVDGESHVVNPQFAADVIHRVFPLAPIPMRIEPTHTDPEFTDMFGTDWLVDLDAGTYQAVAAGDWFHVRLNHPNYHYIELEVPQP
jgi:hypothetical protein